MIRLALILPLALLSISGFTQMFVPANSQMPAFLTTNNSMDVEAIDVDGDEDLDLVIATEYGQNLLFFNDGNGNFTVDPERIFPEWDIFNQFEGEDSEDIGFADFDLDGDLDIVFVSEDTPNHELLSNDGTGLFTYTAYQFPTSVANGLAILDLNNDEYPDIVIGNSGQNQVFINDQDFGFVDETDSRWPINTEWTQDLKLIDLDGDGDMDILEACDQGSDNAYINNDGVFVEESDRLPNQDATIETRKFTLGDVDGDDDLDIFVSTVNWVGNAEWMNRLYVNNGEGYFDDYVFNLQGYSAFTLDGVFVDYDSDDDLDLITTDFQNGEGNHHLFVNDGFGLFTEDTEGAFGDLEFSMGVGVLSADLNGDGKNDLYFANFQQEDDLLFCDVPDDVKEFPSEISLYPNPVKDVFTISADASLQGADYQVYDGVGTLVDSNQVRTTSHQIDASSWAIGTYTISIKVGEKSYALNFEVVR